MNKLQYAFLQLVRGGIGVNFTDSSIIDVDWDSLKALAIHQGLSAVVVDGLEELPIDKRPVKTVLLPWIGLVCNEESMYAAQWKTACELARLLENNQIRTYVLKGAVVSECYPNPNHRVSVDLDCFLQSSDTGVEAWEEGNLLAESAGYEVRRDYYKNSTWILPGLTVENHKWLTPFRGNKKLSSLEKLFQTLLKENSVDSLFEGTALRRPPVMVSALFLIEHAYSHFLHEGLTWRHVLDWIMFSKAHNEEIDWHQLNLWIDEFGFRRFYDSYFQNGRLLLGEVDESELSYVDKMMLADIWESLDLHKTVDGLRGKLALVGNTWRARWKYRHFTDISWLHALWIQVRGVLFIKNPVLE